MKKLLLSILIFSMIVVASPVYAQENHDLNQVESEIVTVFTAILYLDEKLEDAELVDRLKIHIKMYALERELSRLAEIKKELESSQ